MGDTPLPGGGTLAGLAEAAREGIAHVLDPQVLDGLSDGELVGALAQVEALGRAADAARAMLAGQVDHRTCTGWDADGLLGRTGARSGRELVATACGVSWKQADVRMKAARHIHPAHSLSGGLLPAPFPAVAATSATGLMGQEVRELITRTLAAVAPRAHPADLAQAERCLTAAAVGGRALNAHAQMISHLLGQQDADALIDAAPTASRDADEVGSTFAPPTPLRGLQDMARAWAMALDPDGAVPDEQDMMLRRGLTLGRLTRGVIPIRGFLIPETAALLQRQLQAVANPRVSGHAEAIPTADADTGSAPPGADVPDQDGRTPAQRRHDGFMTVLLQAAQSDTMPTLQGAPATLVVTTTVDQLSDDHGVAFLQGTAGQADGAVPVAAAQHAGCAGAIQHVVLDPRGAILGLSSPQRIFTAHQRRAIALRDGTCVIPGCGAPAAQCEVHHVHEHQHGGPTHTDNGVLLCWFHHRFLGLHGWKVRIKDGRPQVKAPPWINLDDAWQDSHTSLHQQWDRTRAHPPGGPPCAA